MQRQAFGQPIRTTGRPLQGRVSSVLDTLAGCRPGCIQLDKQHCRRTFNAVCRCTCAASFPGAQKSHGRSQHMSNRQQEAT
eukprot:214311-Amphidinium_carterae.1